MGVIAASSELEKAKALPFAADLVDHHQPGRRSMASVGALRNVARSAVSWSSRTWGVLDFVLAVACFTAAHFLSPYFHFSEPHAYRVAVGTLVYATSLTFFSCVLGVYDRHNFTSIGRMAAQALAVSVLALAATSLSFEWLGFVHIGRWVIIFSLLLSWGMQFACRMTARELARRAKIRLLLVGNRKKFKRMESHIRRVHRAFYERPVYLSDTSGGVAARRARIIETLIREEPEEIVVMDDDPALMDLLFYSARILRSGCGVFSYSSYHERLLGEVPVHCIDERGMFGTGFDVGSLHTGLVKRPLDAGLALLGLIAGAPLMLVCALLVKLTSNGPIIYKQVRAGRYGRPFYIYKFRTMCVDAERNGAMWAGVKDVRVTPIGKFLRKTRFDELPQLWNILRGDMSLVGPRPERPEFIEQLRQQIPHYDLRHLVPPGLTGWAQVRFRYGSSIEDAQQKLAFDLFYVRHCSLTFDAAICLRTLAAIAKGAR
jgi:exopolysaccharide biosynthesis polyprenyl glycosylphosphotransferase